MILRLPNKQCFVALTKVTTDLNMIRFKTEQYEVSRPSLSFPFSFEYLVGPKALTKKGVGGGRKNSKSFSPSLSLSLYTNFLRYSNVQITCMVDAKTATHRPSNYHNLMEQDCKRLGEPCHLGDRSMIFDH